MATLSTDACGTDPGGKKKVLLVDDSRLVLTVAQAFLRGQYEVSTAACAREALAKAAAERPDLVLIDQNLPDGTGRQFMDLLLRDARTRRIKTVIVTTRTEIEQLGPEVDTLEKPFGPDALRAKVAQSLS